MESRPSSLADVLADRALARLVETVRVQLPRLHSDVRVVETAMDLRAEFRGAAICRIVPYREVLHFQIGDDPVWETRIRSVAEFPDVMERIVRTFLRAFVSAQASPGAGQLDT